ncbi:hypothetical protein CkaCkLH20_10522 [Colletotrichum karsti]|uniref:Tim44-like domain-containing protein n=1 Tax=Colletotrichum karsti TaxID=1095194 RepID=A0A9P6LGS6_9PEZI|nr:uncharacterized protein CkaCkLH20_10522 [Colletotrichum karsti]KAF9871890.1 hypothetical protein CkaCkLH20_10522 [Colletotrichum karsti]
MYGSARPLLGLGRSAAMRPQRIAFPTTARRIPIAAASARGYASKAHSSDMRLNQRLQKEMALKGDKGYSAKHMEAAQLEHMKTVMLPGTFVHLPLSQLDKSPGPLFNYLFARFKQHLKDLAAIVGLKFQSMPKIWQRPRINIHRTQVVPTAKALHHRLAQALAAGDKDTLREICVPRLYDALSAVISRRSSNEKVTWELVQYDGRPRLVSHRLAPLPPQGQSPILQQAVVAISSTQKLGKVEARTGKLIEGNTKLQKPTEYFVIMRHLDPKTYEPTKWRVWGSTQPTTAEGWVVEEKSVKQMEQQDFARRRGHKM